MKKKFLFECLDLKKTILRKVFTRHTIKLGELTLRNNSRGIGKLETVLESALRKVVYSVKHFKQMFIVDDVEVSDTFCNNFNFIFRETVKIIGF